MTYAIDTEVRLLNNVPLTNSYEHQITHTDIDAQTSFFINKTAYSFTDFSYQKADSSVKVPRGRDSLYSCNYLMFRNKEFSSKWFYGFITRIEYVNPNMSQVFFEVDVFQTWQFDFSFHPSYVVREHTQRWNSDGSPVINTVDEGLDYGTEYETVHVSQYVPHNDVFFLVIVCSQRMDVNRDDAKPIEPVVNGAIQPLSYYIVPFKLDGSVPTIMVDGMNQVISPVKEVLNALYTSTLAINNVVNLYVSEYIGHPDLDFPMTSFEPVNIQDKDSNNFTALYVADVPYYEKLVRDFGSKYNGFTDVDESKLLMHPYTVTVLTDMKGNAMEIRNELIRDNNLKIVTRGSIGVSNKVSYNVENYRMNEFLVPQAGEVSIENGIINNNPNDVPIISDMLSAYLQGNRNSLENQKNQIVWGGFANTVGNLFGGIGSAMSRNPVGVVSAGAGMASGAVNTYFQIQGLQAKQKDLNAMPPQLSKMGGNTAFDYGNGIKGLYIIKREITPEYRKRLGDFFKMFGYKINSLKTPDLKSRTHFNYIQTTGANLTGNVPQPDILRLKDMFNNGVTLWHGDWVGDYALANGER